MTTRWKVLSLDLKTSLRTPLLYAFAAGLITAAVTLLLPNYYRSEARLLPVESKGIGGNLGGLASAAAAFGVSLPGGDSSDANYVDVLSSRWLREQILQETYTYHVRSWRFGEERAEQGTMYKYLKSKNPDRALRDLAGVLTATRDLKTKIVTINAETRSPELSQLVANRAGKLLEVFLQEKGRTRGGAKAAYAEARLVEARKEMEEAEASLRSFLEGNRNFQISSDPSVRLKGLRLEAELRLRQQLVTSIAMSREQALMEEKNDIPILNIMDSANLPIEKSKPVRSTLVFLAMFLVGVGSWGWMNRQWIQTRLLAEEPDEEPNSKENS